MHGVSKSTNIKINVKAEHMDGVQKSHLFSTNINFNIILDIILKHDLFN